MNTTTEAPNPSTNESTNQSSGSAKYIILVLILAATFFTIKSLTTDVPVTVQPVTVQPVAVQPVDLDNVPQ